MNKKSILFVGYSWNLKHTASSVFFVDYLKEKYAVDFLLDQEDLNELVVAIKEKSYSAVLFFQLQPPKGLYNRSSCKNMIFIPMFDMTPVNTKFLWKYRNYKVIAFCRKYYELLSKYKRKCVYIQYYPEPDNEAINKKKDTFLFWQRRIECCWDSVKTIVGDFSNFPSDVTRFHFHNAPDDKRIQIKPSEKDIEDYHMTVSTWFNDFKEYEDILDSAALFIAPRTLEGIGLSFLDAMAKGAVIIANDAATMNEYVDFENGYLFDFSKPERIDFSGYKIKQEKSISRLRQGRNKFLSDINGLSEFIDDTSYKRNTTYFYVKFIFRFVIKVIKVSFLRIIKLLGVTK